MIMISMHFEVDLKKKIFFALKVIRSLGKLCVTEPTSSGAGSVDIDLDVISSRDVTALNTAAARHKIAIKQKSKRPKSHISSRRSRANSPVS